MVFVKKGLFGLKDNFETFPLKFNEDRTINLLNSKILNLLDDLQDINGIDYFRLVFTTESLKEIIQIIKIAQDRLEGNYLNKSFDGLRQYNKCCNIRYSLASCQRCENYRR